MLLLIPNAVLFDYDGSVSFTFHYASTYTWHPIPCRDRFLYLHSTMLLLIHIPIAKSTKIGNIFTFHYASTYTDEGRLVVLPCKVFTFHYASTYTKRHILIDLVQVYLHSTMLLLIRPVFPPALASFANLHSTMLLLIRYDSALFNLFFHYLHSTMLLLIRRWTRKLLLCPPHLHSTMLLLIHDDSCEKHREKANLHSTMLLLIRRSNYRRLA